MARRGFDGAGAVLLKLNRLDGTAQLLRPAWTDGDHRRWLARPPGPEAEADEEIARETARDPDIWVLEIEDREGRHPLDDRWSCSAKDAFPDRGRGRGATLAYSAAVRPGR